MSKKIKAYVISIIIALATGGISALLTRESMNIYAELNTPPFSPPSILFPIVWSILYVLMGVSAAIIYTSKNTTKLEREDALYLYGISLVINFSWSIIFFRFRAFLLAFFWLILLLFLVVKTITAYKRINKTAAYLQIPYALWVTFAGYLNFAIWYLNR
jgi:tryptophan-rich sensory protein